MVSSERCACHKKKQQCTSKKGAYLELTYPSLAGVGLGRHHLEGRQGGTHPLEVGQAVRPFVSSLPSLACVPRPPTFAYPVPIDDATPPLAGGQSPPLAWVHPRILLCFSSSTLSSCSSSVRMRSVIVRILATMQDHYDSSSSSSSVSSSSPSSSIVSSSS